MLNEGRGILFVLSAPSGAGKTTVAERVLQECPELRRTISATSRPPRPGEEEGRDYIFLSEEEFRKRIEEGVFLEWACVHGNLYGTPREQVEAALREGQDLLLVIDVQGGMQVKKLFEDAVLIFLVPPSFEVLQERLQKRGTEGTEEVAKRLANAREEMKLWRNYDYVVVNDVLEEAVDKVLSIIKAERARCARIKSLPVEM